MITAILPSRNEPYLQQTIDSLLSNAGTEIEIIVILDGYWANPPIKDDKRVVIIHNTEPKGMRAGINSAVAIAKGNFLMKADAHCMFSNGFGKELINVCKDNWVIVPRRYPLDPEKWIQEERNDSKYPIDYEYIHPLDLHGVEWRQRRDERKDIMIDETMTAQGSCWFMKKTHFEFIEGLDEENYGSFFLEFQEISFKTWLSGGKVMVDKNVSYHHWHKTDGRGYSLKPGEREKAVDFIKKWKNGTAWSKQSIPFEEMINRFKPIPGWI